VVRRGISALVVEAMSKPAHRKASHVAQPAHPDGEERRPRRGKLPAKLCSEGSTNLGLAGSGRPRDWVELVARVHPIRVQKGGCLGC
jgi:hypothetical protein